MLSWAIVIEKNKTLSENGFDIISASDKINLLLNSIGLNNSIPKYLVNIIKYAKAENIGSGPELITRIRNLIVHSKDKSRLKLSKFDNTIYQEVTDLSIWYIESCLLYLIGYKGRRFRPFGDDPLHSPKNIEEFQCSETI